MDTNEARRAVEAMAGFRPASVRSIGGGWGAWTFVIDGRWVFRWSRADGARTEACREVPFLRELANHLATTVDVQVPEPVWSGSWNGAPGYGYRRIGGRAVRPDDVVWWPALPEVIAGVLTGLHGFPGDRACELLDVPDPRSRRDGDLHVVGKRIRADVEPLLAPNEADRLRTAWGRFVDLPPEVDPVAIHGDLGMSHVLVDPHRHRVTGLIDFEMATVGDAAADFVGCLITLGQAFTDRVVDAYDRPTDRGFMDRIVAYRWLGAVHAVLHGIDHDRPDEVVGGLDGIRRRLPR